MKSEETVVETTTELRPEIQIQDVGLYRNNPDKPWDEVYGESETDRIKNGEAFVTVENTGSGPEAITELIFSGDVPNPIENPRGSGMHEADWEVVVEQCGRDEPEPVERTDPREKLTQSELAAANNQAMRISDEVQGGWSRAVVAKQLVEKVQRGEDVTKAVLETLEELKAVPGAIVPIADVPDVPVGEVTVQGEITELWTPGDNSTSRAHRRRERANEIHGLGEERENGCSRGADGQIQSIQKELVPRSVQSCDYGLESDRIPRARPLVGRIAS